MAALLVLSACAGAGDREPLVIGVLAPLDGGDDTWREPIELAFSVVNGAGGVAGRRLEPLYVDPATAGLEVAIDRVLPVRGVRAVITGDTSENTRVLADRLLSAGQVTVAYAATSSELFQSHAGRRLFWRTVESDASQARYLLALAVRDGARTGAFLASADEYGDGLFGWLGFFAIEQGLPITAAARFEPGDDCAAAVNAALSGTPDVLLVAPPDPGAAGCVWREARRQSPGTRVLVTDRGYPTGVIPEDLEGLEGTSPAPDPDSGFARDFVAAYGHRPPQYAAQAYDAVLLVAYGLARSGGRGGTALGNAMAELVAAPGEPVPPGAAGVQRALESLRGSVLPRVRGATGPLDFDEDFFVDPVTTFYEHWRVADGVPVAVETASTDEVRAEAWSVATHRQEKRAADDPEAPAPPPVGEHTSTWALVAATSVGWDNYRHQAEALAFYRLLRDNGLDDDHIVLVLADDVAHHPANPEPGVVRLVPGGPDVRAGAVIDYDLAAITAEDLLLVLGGERSVALPHVISGDAGANVFVFLAGHGAGDGLHLGVGDDPSVGESGRSVLRPQVFADALAILADEERFRRVLVAIESCQSGAIGAAIDAPRVAVLTASSPNESSLATGWDASLGNWRADEFALGLYRAATTAPHRPMTDTYLEVYRGVLGSHVGFFNVARWANPDEIDLGEFLARP